MPGSPFNASMQMSRRVALGLVLMSLLALAAYAGPLQAEGMPRAERHEGRHAIDKLENAWRNAFLKANTTAMENLLADDFMGISASGTLQTKDQMLANLRTGRMHLTALDLSDRKIRFYGKTALVTSQAAVQGTNVEGDISGNYRYTHVYVRDGRGSWKIVSFEASKIRDSNEHK